MHENDIRLAAEVKSTVEIEAIFKVALSRKSRALEAEKMETYYAGKKQRHLDQAGHYTTDGLIAAARKSLDKADVSRECAVVMAELSIMLWSSDVTAEYALAVLFHRDAWVPASGGMEQVDAGGTLYVYNPRHRAHGWLDRNDNVRTRREETL